MTPDPFEQAVLNILEPSWGAEYPRMLGELIADIAKLKDEAVNQELSKILLALPPSARKHIQPLFEAALAKLKESE